MDSPLVEAAIGLVVAWFLLASLTSGIVEFAAACAGIRAKNLWRVIRDTLTEGNEPPRSAAGRARQLARTPAIGANNGPFARFLRTFTPQPEKTVKQVAWIDSKRFAASVLTVEKGPGFDSTTLGQAMAALPDEIKNDVEARAQWIQQWFDGVAAEMQADFRRRIRWWAGVAAAFVVVILGADSLGLAARLYRDPTQRAVMLAEAEQIVATTLPPTTEPETTEPETTEPETTPVDPPPKPTTTVAPVGVPTCTASTSTTAPEATTVPGTTTTEVPFGDQLQARLTCVRDVAGRLPTLQLSAWQDRPDTCGEWLRTIAGLIVTWGALLFGAPFWFSVLKRIMTGRTRAGGAA